MSVCIYALPEEETQKNIHRFFEFHMHDSDKYGAPVRLQNSQVPIVRTIEQLPPNGWNTRDLTDAKDASVAVPGQLGQVQESKLNPPPPPKLRA